MRTMSTRTKTRKNSRRRASRLKALGAMALTGPMAAAGLAVGSAAPAGAASPAPATPTQPGTRVATPIPAPGGPAAAQAAAASGELCWTTGDRKFYKTDVTGLFNLWSIGTRTDWCYKNGNFSRFLYHNNTKNTEIIDHSFHWDLWPPAAFSGTGWYNDEYRTQWLFNPVYYCAHVWGLFYSGYFTMDINTGTQC